ncbi:MAG: OmpA family protein [Pirellulales bacterium]|nr:OmpA family protein [Pirellulales bacterium]
MDRAGPLLLTSLALAWACGCTQQNPYLAGGQPSLAQQQQQLLQQQQAALQPQMQQAQLAMTQQNQELMSRISALDRDNQELDSLLAQARQQNQIYAEQLTALRDQLGGAAQQLAQTRQQQQQAEQRAQTLAASSRRRTGASISANNSLQEALPVITVPGVETRFDGDVIRIELPADLVFEPGTNRLLPQASATIDLVAAEVLRLHGRQLIGVEGHTDSDPPTNPQWVNNHQLSVGRALAVYDYLVSRTQLRPDQMFIVGHGANHPVVSNATPAGKARNRRVELVIYPERLPGR